MKPSTDTVLRVLRLRGEQGATELDIWRLGGIKSGAQRIKELRDAGYRIDMRWERHGPARFGRYVLREEEAA